MAKRDPEQGPLHTPERQADPRVQTTADQAAMLVQPRDAVAARTWRIVAGAGLRLRCWDDECVLFHGASGDTHRLPEPVGRLLERLCRAPATVAGLSDAVDLHEDDVALSLEELARLWIVEPVR